MKKKVLILIAVAVVALAAAFYYSNTTGKEEQAASDYGVIDVKKNQLPDLGMTGVDKSKTSFRDLKGNVALIFFSPDCDHCQHQAEIINANKDIFKGYQLYFTSSDSIKAINEYAIKYNLIEPNMHFGHSEGIDVYRTVGPLNQIPTWLVFKDQAFIARLDGTTSAERLRVAFR